jgi:hypothetical protein
MAYAQKYLNRPEMLAARPIVQNEWGPIARHPIELDVGPLASFMLKE